MRITGGTMRGRVLTSKVRTGVRPTSSRVREALFSMLGQDLSDVTVLDGFGGSGLISFEAMSRGAEVTTVERNRPAAAAIKSNAEHLKVKMDLRITDLRNVLASGQWDVVILDPPYADDPVEWVAEASACVREVLVIEHKSGASLPEQVGALIQDVSRRYGDSSLTIYRRGPDSSLEEADVVP